MSDYCEYPFPAEWTEGKTFLPAASARTRLLPDGAQAIFRPWDFRENRPAEDRVRLSVYGIGGFPLVAVEADFPNCKEALAAADRWRDGGVPRQNVYSVGYAAE